MCTHLIPEQAGVSREHGLTTIRAHLPAASSMVDVDAKSAWDVEVDGEFRSRMFIGSGPFSQKSLKIGMIFAMSLS